MPIYTLICRNCNYSEDVLIKHEEKGEMKFDCDGEGEEPYEVVPYATINKTPQSCPHDGHHLYWQIAAPVLDFNGNKSGRFQMHAITNNGQRIAGHFGKSARLERKK